MIRLRRKIKAAQKAEDGFGSTLRVIHEAEAKITSAAEMR